MSAGGPVLPTTFCWRLAGAPGPSVSQALRVGEALRAAFMHSRDRLGLDRLTDVLHATNGPGRHRHFYWLSEDRDRDGHIDHVAAHAYAGLPAAEVGALAFAGPLWLGRDGEWALVPVSLGRTETFIGPAKRWSGATAFVTRLWRTNDNGQERQDYDPEGQLRREIDQQGLPQPRAVFWQDSLRVAGQRVKARHFLSRTAERQAPRDAWKGFPMIEFEVPIAGPLAFGFGSHFGLGLMLPVG
jgi:CRISPR-associated protein Csb2